MKLFPACCCVLLTGVSAHDRQGRIFKEEKSMNDNKIVEGMLRRQLSDNHAFIGLIPNEDEEPGGSDEEAAALFGRKAARLTAMGGMNTAQTVIAGDNNAVHMLNREAGFVASAAADDEKVLRVMQYNIWGAGMNENKPVDDTVAVILAVNADIVGMQETRAENPDCLPGIGDSAAKAVADALGFYYYDQTHVMDYDPKTYAIFDNAIISRYPILNSTKEDIGVKIDVGDGRMVYAFNIHLPDYPYQPYQLMNITYGEAPFLTTEEEAIDDANQARGKGMDRFYSDLKEVDKDDVVFIFGDFNEPSYLDWTEAAAEAGYHPIKVEYPTSKKLADNGFVDALRQVFPDEVTDPKFSWPTLLATDAPVKDRIDFIYVRGKGTKVIDAGIVGEDLSVADIVYEPWPSDHRAVVATVSIVNNSDEEYMMSMAKAEKKMSMKGGVVHSDEESMTSLAKADKKMFTQSFEAKASKMFKGKKE